MKGKESDETTEQAKVKEVISLRTVGDEVRSSDSSQAQGPNGNQVNGGQDEQERSGEEKGQPPSSEEGRQEALDDTLSPSSPAGRRLLFATIMKAMAQLGEDELNRIRKEVKEEIDNEQQAQKDP